MDKDQKEFTDQIRSAIKTKLADLNALVDDELPDYIMILIANKRSKSQILKDLDLFLGEETSKFTDWLCDMVQSCKLKGKSSASNKDEVKRKIEKEDDIDVLDCDVSDQGSDLEEDVKSHKINKVKVEPTRITDVPLPPKVIQRPDKTSSQQDYSNTAYISPFESAQAVQPEDEYDPTKPHISGCMSSVVHISQKNYGRPASLQPNKLLLRAVNDATKSVLHGQNVNDYYKPTPIDVLSVKKQNYARYRNLVNVKIDPDIEHQSTPSTAETVSYDKNELDVYLEREFPSTTPTRTFSVKSESGESSEKANYSLHLNDSEIHEDPQVLDSTHFIVTLDGVGYSLKRKFSETSEEAMDVDEEEGLPEDTLGSKRAKLPVRCKYWPSCKNNSDECGFHHPIVPCKKFPDCTFGDQCFYIHPDCKFDDLCSKKDCPFTHASKRSFPLKSAPKKKSNKKRGVKTVCKFYPECTSTNCPFVHPKPCRYGTKCRSSVCPFTHFNIPSRNQLIWKASA